MQQVQGEFPAFCKVRKYRGRVLQAQCVSAYVPVLQRISLLEEQEQKAFGAAAESIKAKNIVTKAITKSNYQQHLNHCK